MSRQQPDENDINQTDRAMQSPYGYQDALRMQRGEIIPVPQQRDYGQGYNPDEILMPSQTREDYWNQQRSDIEKQFTYDPRFNQQRANVLTNARLDIQAELGLLDKAIADAYGAAGAQAQRGARSIYEEGQRGAGEIAGSAEAAAARAAGYLSGQGMPQTMVSNVAGTSGGASFDPTMGRAYGGIGAEAFGRNAAYDAQGMAARGSGMSAGRQSLLDQFTVTSKTLLNSLALAEIDAREAKDNGRRNALAALDEKMRKDVLDQGTLNLIARRADQIWDNNEDLKELYGRNRAAYDAAINQLLEQKSRAILEKFWADITFMAGAESDDMTLLRPTDDAIAAAMQQLTQ